MIDVTKLTPDDRLTHERLLTWDIREGDVAIVIGGYQGVTCELIMERYPSCQLYTWEPQNKMYDVLKGKLAKYPNAHVYNYGLGIESGSFPMVLTGSDQCSFITSYLHHEIPPPDSMGILKEFTVVMDSLGIKEIAWLHMNIEGYEHLLLPYIIKTGWMGKIGQFVLATHDGPKHNPMLFSDIVEQMAFTHQLWWQQRQFIAWSQPNRIMREVAIQ